MAVKEESEGEGVRNAGHQLCVQRSPNRHLVGQLIIVVVARRRDAPHAVCGSWARMERGGVLGGERAAGCAPFAVAATVRGAHRTRHGTVRSPSASKSTTFWLITPGSHAKLRVRAEGWDRTTSPSASKAHPRATSLHDIPDTPSPPHALKVRQHGARCRDGVRRRPVKGEVEAVSDSAPQRQQRPTPTSHHRPPAASYTPRPLWHAPGHAGTANSTPVAGKR